MGDKNLVKRSIFKEKISELKAKKFSFEIFDFKTVQKLNTLYPIYPILITKNIYFISKE